MYPVNQVILGNGRESMFNDIDSQIQMMEVYKNKLQQLKQSESGSKTTIWDNIDSEIRPLSQEQRLKLFENKEYKDISIRLQELVQNELLNLVKGKIEDSLEGKELLEKQLRLAKDLKGKIVEDSNKEMELFRKFREFSISHPGATYDEFIKTVL